MKRTLRTSCILLILFLVPAFVFAQEFGGTPASLHWRQLNSDTLRVIYRPGLDSMASGIRYLVQRMAEETQPTIGGRLNKINLVLHELTVQSNAYVSLGPYRSEFYLTPQTNAFELGSLPWYQTLAVHEYRHVQQFNNFRKGLSLVMYYLAGELGQSLANSAAIPNWFWEGDAVFQETLISPQGRGRLPHFIDGYRSLWVSHKRYSWMKLRNGSLRDYVPDHYQLGYLLTAYGREKYGDRFWENVTNDAVRFKGLFYPFQKAVKKYSGLSYGEFTRQALDFFSGQMPAGEPGALAREAEQERHFSGNEEFPQWINHHTIIYLGSSYKEIPKFSILDLSTGKLLRLRTRDISTDHYFSYRNGNVVYSAFRPDPRWAMREYSDIRLLEVSSRAQKRVTLRGRYFTPDISNDGRRVVAVQQAADGGSELHLIDPATGKIVRRISGGAGWYFSYPKFLGADSLVAAVRDQTGRMGIIIVNANGGGLRTVIPFSYQVIGFLNTSGDSLSFSSLRGRRDDLMFYWRDSLFEYRDAELNGITGDYQPSLLGNQLAWSAFSAAGMKLLHEEIKRGILQPVSLSDYLADSLPVFGITVLDSASRIAPALHFPIVEGKPYSKGHGLVHFHSWLPAIDDPEYSLSLIGENLLNTFQPEIYFTYNRNEQSKTTGFRATYGGWFPWLRAGAEYSFGRRADLDSFSVHYNSLEWYAGLGLPLHLSGGRWYREFLVTTDLVFSKPYIERAYKDRFYSKEFTYWRVNLQFTNQVQQARLHIFPRWAESVKFNGYRAIAGREGAQAMVSVNWYTPGLSATHSLVFQTAAHWRDNKGEVNFTNSFPFSRGYIARNFEKMYRMGLNYHLPLAYPDWGFGNIVYFLRIRMNLYYDQTWVQQDLGGGRIYAEAYRSYGAECYFDTRWWNQESISFGIRYSRLADASLQGISPNQFAFILPVNIFRR